MFDQTPDEVERIMTLMQEMQRCGAPPTEIMADVAPDMQFGEDGSAQFGSGLGPGSLPPGLQDELARGCSQQ